MLSVIRSSFVLLWVDATQKKSLASVSNYVNTTIFATSHVLQSVLYLKTGIKNLKTISLGEQKTK